jgi:hypothetical protein
MKMRLFRELTLRGQVGVELVGQAKRNIQLIGPLPITSIYKLQYI